MQLGIESHIPEGLLAANALLAENSHQGVPTSTQALYRGFEFAISSTVLGLEFRCYESASDPVVAPSKDAPLSPYALAVFKKVASNTAGFPNICSAAGSVNVGVGDNGQTGYSYDSSKGLQGTSTQRIYAFGPFSLSIKGTSGKISGSATVRAPVTQVGAGVGFNQNGITSVSASVVLGSFQIAGTLTLGGIGDATCGH